MRQAARRFLDRASVAIDRVATRVRDRVASRTGADVAPPASVETVAPARPAERRNAVAPARSAERRDAVAPARPAERRDAVADAPDLHDLTKAQLYRLAQEHDIAGRSKLSKDELVEALQAAGR